jgi:hypothetical protein
LTARIKLLRGSSSLSSVMPGFVPDIHVLAAKEDVDGRDKPGHDESELAAADVIH